MRRSGYSAAQIRRLMAEVAAAEAEEAERIGLPGLGKMRDTVSRQTVERWAKGQSSPKGWWARIVLIVIGRLEQTLESGFGIDVQSADGPSWLSRDVRFPFVVRWVMPVVFLVTLLGLAVVLSGASGEVDFDDPPADVEPTGHGEPSTPNQTLFPVGATPAVAPPAADGGPAGPRGNGCDPEPALPWWAAGGSPPLADGPWFGHVLEVETHDAGGHTMIFDIACFYLQPGNGVRVDPGSPDLEHETAIALRIPEGITVHWPDGSGHHVETDVDAWLDASAGSTEAYPVTCPSGRCSAWVLVVDGIVADVVVVDFERG